MTRPAFRMASPKGSPLWPAWQAPSHWQSIDFISDLHLQIGDPATFKTWQHFMQTTPANALFILGDLCEVWVGDDVMTEASGLNESSNFEVQCAQVLKAASQRLDIFFIHGNRDFLVGTAFAKRSGMTLLNDPTPLIFAGQRWLLSHGDALCLGDTDYQQFREQVRSATWQQEFLAKPLAERQQIARTLRSQSDMLKRSGATYADVEGDAACNWLHQANAQTLIHGHTHKPATHALKSGLSRIVLSDWDALAVPARAEVLRVSVSPDNKGASLQRLKVALAA